MTRGIWKAWSGRTLRCGSAVLALLAGIAVASPVLAQEVELKLITGFPFDGPGGDRMYGPKQFIERFNQRAKGKARIRLIGGPEVVAPFDQLKALQTGQFDMMVTSSLFFTDLKSMHFINYITSAEQVRGMPKGRELLQRVTQEQASVAFVGLATPGFPFYIWSRQSKPLSTVADAKGLKLRGLPGVNEHLVRSLGMVPTNVPSNEVYSALRSGIIDAAIRDVVSVDLLNEGEFARTRTEARVCDCSSEIYIANPSWNKLSAEVKQLLNDIAGEVERDAFPWLEKRAAQSAQALEKKYGATMTKGSPDLNDTLGRKIPGAMIRDNIKDSKVRDQLISVFELAPYLKD
ncbi:MAG: TRAP transporter substrate-binding protein [Burkholderiales bacterium]